MRIEDEIKQSQFKNLDQKVAVNLIFTTNWLVAQQEPRFKKHGITMQQFNVLRILRGQYPKFGTIPMIRERVLDKQPDVSRMLDRLVTKKLVQRQLDPNDHRKLRFLITDTGLKLLDAMDKEEARSKPLAGGLTQTEKKTLSDLLDKLRG